MTEFRRLISYIYEYEGKVKGKNVGFAKLETRNGLCKLNISVKKLYMGSGNLGVYLLSARKEIFLGNMYLRNGSGEFRTVVQAANIEQSGEAIDDCYGLTIHERKDAWKVYTTIWEDTAAQAAQLSSSTAVMENISTVSENPAEKWNNEIPKTQKNTKTNLELKGKTTFPKAISKSLIGTSKQETNHTEASIKANHQEALTQGFNWQKTQNQEPKAQKLSEQDSNVQEAHVQDNHVQETPIQENNPQEATSQRSNAQEAFTQGSNTQAMTNSKFIHREVPNGQESMRHEVPSGQESMRHEAPSGQESMHREVPSGQETIHREEPSGQETIHHEVPSGQETIHREAPSGQETIHREAPSGQESIHREEPSGHQESIYREVPSSQESSAQETIYQEAPTQESIRQESVTQESVQQKLPIQENSGQALSHQQGHKTAAGNQPRGKIIQKENRFQEEKRPQSPMSSRGFGNRMNNHPTRRSQGQMFFNLRQPPVSSPQTPGVPAASAFSPARTPASTPAMPTDATILPRQTAPIPSAQMAPPNSPVQAAVPSLPTQPAASAPTLQTPISPLHTNGQNQQAYIRQHEEEPLIIGDPEALEKLEKEEKMPQIPIWDFLSKTYPKIQAFESQYGCEILVIKPQDIGLLPRETWIYGNNSFLLHGYYNYRYLILARLENPNGLPRHLLGVPGHYYSNEKYMASMFGFPNFVLSKKQQAQDGRFGYWYTDIRLGDGNIASAVVRHTQRAPY